MKDGKKLKLSRWLIFFSFTFAIFMEILTAQFPEVKAFNADSLIMAAIGFEGMGVRPTQLTDMSF